MIRRRALALVLIAALSGCKTVTELTPAPVDDVRRAVFADDADRGKRFHLMPDDHAVLLGDLRAACTEPKPLVPGCMLDDPNAAFAVETKRDVADGSAIASGIFAAALLGGLVAGNAVCFGSNDCGDGGRIALGVTDAVVVLGTAFFVVMWLSWRNFRGD